MLNIYCTNTHRNGANYINGLLKAVNQRALDKHHIVIVPDRASLEAERSMLRAVGGSFNIAVLTFSRLANMLLPSNNYMSKSTGIVALSSIIEECSSQLKCFVKGHGNSGFCSEMYDTISALKYCKVSPADLQAGSYPDSLAPKMHDIALLYSRYQQLLASGYVDSADKLSILSRLIVGNKYIANSYFYIYDFDNFSSQELDIIMQLVMYSHNVTVACPFSDENNYKYLYLNDMYNGLLNECEKLFIKPNIITGVSHTNKHAEQIGKALFTYNQVVPIENNNFLSVFDGDNRVQELYHLACAISRYVRSGGRYRDVFVVTSDITSYANTIHTIFGQFNIPYFCDTQYCLADHAYTQYIVDYMDMIASNLQSHNVCSVVKNVLSPYAEEGYDFVNYTGAYNINYRLDNFTLGKNQPYYEGACRVAKHLSNIISEVSLANQDSAEGYVEAVRRLISVANLNEQLVLLKDRQTENNLGQYARVSQQVADKVEEVLTSIVQVLGSSVITLEQFITHFVNGVSAINISVLPTHTDCVLFANMSKARKHDIKYLAILGANYAKLPIIKHDAVLLSDSNIMELNDCGINIEPTVLVENKRERFSLYQLLQEPETHLHISYAKSDYDGSMLPSPFVEDIMKLFTCNGQPIKLSDSDDGVFSNTQAISKLLSNKGRLEVGQKVSIDYYAELSRVLADQLVEFGKLYDSRNLSINNGDKLLLDNMSSSVTKITTFFSCPHKYFYNYGLGAKPRIKSQLDASMVGNILHEVLENYVRDTNQATDSETAIVVRKIFKRVMSADIYQALSSQKMYVSLLARLEKECIKMCQVIKKQLKNTSYTNYAAECEFGNGKQLPAVTVDYGSGKFVLTGKIDRIDKFGDKFIVIDYKSGAVSYDETEVYIGNKLQLLVYLQAVVKAIKQPSGFYYFKLHNEFAKDSEGQKYSFVGRTLADKDIVKAIDNTFGYVNKSQLLSVSLNKDGEFAKASKILTAKQIDEHIAYCTQLIAEAGKLLTKGYIAVNPYEGSCKYCDYKGICDFGDIYNHSAREVTTSVKPNDIKGVQDNG